jgi:hypothetical protein
VDGATFSLSVPAPAAIARTSSGLVGCRTRSGSGLARRGWKWSWIWEGSGGHRYLRAAAEEGRREDRFEFWAEAGMVRGS